MKNKISALFICSVLFLLACAQQKKSSVVSGQLEPVAFPGAEGFGKHTTGGRGGKVVIVENLKDNGPGSLREAVEMKVPRIIVFAVSGTIHLESPLLIRQNATIAGQTAPGDGICIADHPVKLNGDNIIIRYLRMRLGDRYQNKGQVHGSGHDDAVSANERKHIIIDHCSMSWSNDEVFSVYGGDSVTVQWNIMYEPLNYSYHFETGDKDFENHGYGGIWGGQHLSAHHNLFAHCVSRTPRFQGIRRSGSDLVDYRNNVIYNWQHNNVYGGEGGTYNLVNNYYKYGPQTGVKVRSRIVNPSRLKEPVIPYGKYYVSGNVVDGSEDVSADNTKGVHITDGTEEDKRNALVSSPFAFSPLEPQSARDAYEEILKHGGASLPRRDTVDLRIMNDVRNRTGRIIDVQGGYPHGTPYEQSRSAWPVLNSVPAPADTDKDGMPDNWERKKGLDPANSSDASGNQLHRFYSNIEVYINSLTEAKPL